MTIDDISSPVTDFSKQMFPHFSTFFLIFAGHKVTTWPAIAQVAIRLPDPKARARRDFADVSDPTGLVRKNNL
jgi:hypothetical protein